MGLEERGVIAEAEGGVGISSSMVKIPSVPERGFISGLNVGDGVFLARVLGVALLVVSRGDNIGERGFQRQGCLTRGAGISCKANQSLHFSMALLTSSPDLDAPSFFNCF